MENEKCQMTNDKWVLVSLPLNTIQRSQTEVCAAKSALRGRLTVAARWRSPF